VGEATAYPTESFDTLGAGLDGKTRRIVIYEYMSQAAPTVKIGTSRQVVIPKKIHDQLGLSAGDYLEVELQGAKVVMTPKTLVDKAIQARLAEGLEDARRGRVVGPFRSAKALIRALHRKPARRK